MFKKIAGFFQKYPEAKVLALGFGSMALASAAQGQFGPKAAAGAAAITTIIGLFIRRPQDAGPDVKS